jgi:hypothetical protein
MTIKRVIKRVSFSVLGQRDAGCRKDIASSILTRLISSTQELNSPCLSTKLVQNLHLPPSLDWVRPPQLWISNDGINWPIQSSLGSSHSFRPVTVIGILRVSKIESYGLFLRNLPRLFRVLANAILWAVAGIIFHEKETRSNLSLALLAWVCEVFPS